MQLPNNEIGVSDLLAYLDCPRRMAYGMRRHLRGADGAKQDPPESQSPATAYGSAFHDCVHLVEEDGLTEQEAVERVFAKWGGWLEPADVTRLFRDLDTFERRDFRGVRTLAQEDDLRVPLMEYDGETIYFRFKLDKLYQRLNDEGSFIHVDYKTSKWAKTQEDVDEDPQMWAYNWAIFEYWPECEDLIQVYDQLRYGTVTTRKSDAQREEIRRWLQIAAKSVIEDRDMKPRFNQWCPYCPISGDCPVPRQLSDYALSRIAVLAPSRKEGRKKVIDLDPSLYDVYLTELPKMDLARKTLEKVSDEIRTTVKQMPEEQQQEHGYTATLRAGAEFTPEGMKLLRERIGDDEFLDLASVSKTRLSSRFKDDPELLEELLGYMEERDGAVVLKGPGVDSS